MQYEIAINSDINTKDTKDNTYLGFKRQWMCFFDRLDGNVRRCLYMLRYIIIFKITSFENSSFC